MGKEDYKEGRRTYPAYLTRGEYERQQSRLNEMVKGITVTNPTKRKKNTKTNPMKVIGVTENFYVKIDKKQKTVIIKERNITVQCPFKLSIKHEEVENIIKLLTKSVEVLSNRQ